MQDEILKKIEECFLIAEKFYGRTFERPTNVLFKRSGTTGGHSNFYKRELMFQLDLAENNRTDFIEKIVPHEVAHYIQRAVYGYFNGRTKVMPHGKEWKFVITRVFRITPSRCHSYDTTVTKTRKQTRYKWSGCACEGKVFNLTATRTNKGLTYIKKWGISPYKCPSCDKSLKFIDRILSPEEIKIQKIKKQLEKLQQFSAQRKC